MKITPLSDHIFIEAIEEEKTTKSGIVLPDTVEKERPIKGKVVAVGPGRLDEKGQRVAMSIKVGDKVLFKKYGPDEVKVEDASGKDKEYLVAREEDILAIID